jgi:ParB-like chromosome segregation protein Spo0J
VAWTLESKMILRSIPKDKIRIPKPDSRYRTFDKEHARALAESIMENGLLHPPIVRPLADDFFEVVVGRHRTYAMGKILEWDEIPCSVDDQGRYKDDREAEMAAIVENVQHAALSPAQLYASLARWKKIYDELHPDGGGSGSNLRERMAALEGPAKAAAEAYIRAKADALEAQVSGDEAKIEETTKAEEEAKAKVEDIEKQKRDATKHQAATKTETFAAQAAKITGKKKTQVYADTMVAERLTSEQIEALMGRGIKKGGLLDLARITDPKARNKAVNCILGGMTLEEGIMKAGEEAKPVPKAKGAKGKAAAKAAPDTKVEEASTKTLTDDEWLTTVVGKIWSELKKKSQFRRDALLYRRTEELRTKIQKGVKKLLQESKSDGLSPYYNILYRAAFTRHPSLWKICGKCAGTGKDKETGENCKDCRGAAFRTEVEYI